MHVCHQLLIPTVMSRVKQSKVFEIFSRAERMTPGAEGLRNAAAPERGDPRRRGGQDPSSTVPSQTRITCFGPGSALRPGFLTPNHEAERSSLGPHTGTPLRHHDGGTSLMLLVILSQSFRGC